MKGGVKVCRSPGKTSGNAQTSANGYWATNATTPLIVWRPAIRTLMLEMLAIDDRIRWFSDTGYVVRRAKLAEVFVAGTLIGRFTGRQVGVRNLLLVGLAQDPKIR